ncbi:hypothetical protein [Streptomyces sp. NBC_01445]|uniref:hypothetical protein n=1 Tax=Streptomyces sp. NBC_01445 TaxID=2903869 RepID=UPI002DDB0F50|nr:hypothetical protein [Streptomyces sp. NBC_01445]WSE05148.1 DUF2500 domain-containing protein [Streptomyces sp. NBC_01445]
MTRRAHAVMVAMAVGAVALLAGCSLPDGPSGVVVARAERTPPASKNRPYFLTVRTANGDRKDFQVYIGDYDQCSIGERYPACKQ